MQGPVGTQRAPAERRRQREIGFNTKEPLRFGRPAAPIGAADATCNDAVPSF